jgi:hypothetical protein
LNAFFAKTSFAHFSESALNGTIHNASEWTSRPWFSRKQHTPAGKKQTGYYAGQANGEWVWI